MTNPSDAQSYIGATAVDNSGSKIGKVSQVYLDDQTHQPTWVTVHTGLFGGKETFAPLYGSSWKGDDVALAVSKQLVQDAPNIDADGHLNDDENDRLYTYYSGYLGTPTTNTVTTNTVTTNTTTNGTTNNDTTKNDTTSPTTDDAMTLSEERLKVGTQDVVSGRAKLRKYIVTENVSTTVPLTHEEVRIEREPITDANRDKAMSGADLSEEEHEVTLHAEQAVVTTETVPVERVRLATETVTENQQVTGTVRKEKVDQPEIDPTNG